MKTDKQLSARFAYLGAALIVLTVIVCIAFLDGPSFLLTGSRQAETQTIEFMDALCRNDLESAGAYLLGQPSLVSGKEPGSALGLLLWDAFRESLSYEFEGPCQASDAGLSRPVTVTGLDITGIMGQLKEQAQSLLEEEAAALPAAQVYEDDGAYQEHFVMSVLAEAAGRILQENPPHTTWELTLELKLQDGQWWILPDQALLNLLSGGMGR